jgi:hypothetical protein
VPGGAIVSAALSGATASSPPMPAPFVDSFFDVFYTVTLTENSLMRIVACSSEMDASMVVYDGCPDNGGTVRASSTACGSGACAMGESSSCISVSLEAGT